jgi:hypothetical protein
MKKNDNLDVQHLHKLKKIDFQPVFILGLHRSGTSILYKMLTATGCFNPVTAYHIINYKQLLHNSIHKKEESAKNELTDSLKQQGQKDRGIDRLEITADFAEEYGFLLGQKTVQMNISTKNVDLFSELCKKIQFISGNQKPILLKNPYDFSNFLYIKQSFPNAKFVFIHRHPYKTLSSTIKAIKLLLKNKNPYTSQLFRMYNIIFENPLFLHVSRFLFCRFSVLGVILLTIDSSNAIKYYMKNIQMLPKQDYVVVSYEDLCKKPHRNIENIIESLNISLDKKLDFTSFIHPRKMKLDLSVNQLRRFIFKRMKKYFNYFFYNLEDHI